MWRRPRGGWGVDGKEKGGRRSCGSEFKLQAVLRESRNVAQRGNEDALTCCETLVSPDGYMKHPGWMMKISRKYPEIESRVLELRHDGLCFSDEDDDDDGWLLTRITLSESGSQLF